MKNRNGDRLDTVIGPEANVRGDLRVAGAVRLDGQIEGRMDVTETMVSGPRSLLKGELHCRVAVIAGRIEGDIYAVESVELQRGAQVIGNVTCRELVIQPSCVFQGGCSMAQASERS